MNLCDELLYKELSEHIMCIFHETKFDYEKVIHTKAVKVLQDICYILQTDGLSDFDIVEQIVCVFEEYQIDAGSVHDF